MNFLINLEFNYVYDLIYNIYNSGKETIQLLLSGYDTEECPCGGSCSCNCNGRVTDITIGLFILMFISVFKFIPDLISNKFKNENIKKSDVPLAWGLYFQDGASPSFEGIVDLHNRIMFYLVVILFGVTWVMFSIMWNYNKRGNAIVYRFLNHGKYVPIQKCSKFHNIILKSKRYIPLRFYTTLSRDLLKNNNINWVKVYGNAYNMKKYILEENKGKAGIYMLTNKLTNDIRILW